MRTMLLVLGLVWAGCGAARADCAVAGSDITVEGKLSVGHFHDGMGRPETALILTMPKPICLTGATADDTVKPTLKVQLFGDTDAIDAQLQKAIGKKVRATGHSMPAMTVHHHAPALVQTTSLAIQ